ncbi:hypothetical protein C8K30_103457 [Promicromonospora sp. AC04]|uniref:hypothetical protein n=1 Tax=Promicromonospora sp. AC04 TaxID=2135723 RepID=UPI000D48B747|nr:hypothetical protein [Promicromonospora sp. AC04]PUB29031.1 hypothetical protein C8K30_103457 [Promicromonospora sp. AC04]
MRKLIRYGAVTIVAAATGVVLFAGCTGGSEAECEEAFEGAAQSVDRVASAKFDCSVQLEGSTQIGEIMLDVDTQKAATPVIADVYRAFAAESGLGDARTPFITFSSLNNGKVFDDEFQGSPSISDLREKYDIYPSEAD